MTAYGVADADGDGAPTAGEVTAALRGRTGSPYPWPMNDTPQPPRATNATNPSTPEPSSAKRIILWVCIVVAISLAVPALAAFWLERGRAQPGVDLNHRDV